MISPKNNPFKISVGIRNATDFSPFGVELKGRNFEVVGGGNYRYSFQAQESDSEVKGEGNSMNFKYRMHDPRLGRFFAVDPLTPEYPHNSPYAFSENRVLDALEMEGLEMVLVHGTWAARSDINPDWETGHFHVADYKGESTWAPAKYFVNKVAVIAGWNEKSTYEFGWSGENSILARRKAAKNLVTKLTSADNLEKDKKHVTFMAHSHGGNIAKMAKNKLEKKGWTVDVINIATPQRNDTQSDKKGKGEYLNFYSDNDAVQWAGSGDDGPLGARRDPKANKNVEIDPEKNWFSNSGGHSFHQDLKSREQMLKVIKEEFKDEK